MAISISFAARRRWVHAPSLPEARPGVDEPIVEHGRQANGVCARTWLTTDDQRSAIAATNDAGQILGLYSYGLLGEPSASTGPAFRYTGQVFDADIGLYYYKARWYAPRARRFLQPDPAGDDDGPNLYAYVGNDPINLSDPTGRYGEAAGGFGASRNNYWFTAGGRQLSSLQRADSQIEFRDCRRRCGQRRSFRFHASSSDADSP